MTNSNNVFKIELPEEWKETSVYTFQGPHENGIQHNLVLTINPEFPKGMALAEFARSQVDATASMLPGFEMVEGKDCLLHAKHEGYEIMYKYVPAENIFLFQKQWYFSLNGRVFVFTSTFTQKTMPTLALLVEKIISTLQVNS